MLKLLRHIQMFKIKDEYARPDFNGTNTLREVESFTSHPNICLRL